MLVRCILIIQQPETLAKQNLIEWEVMFCLIVF